MYDQRLILNKITNVLEATDESLIDDFIPFLDRANRIFVSGVGRSGLVSKFFAMRLMHTGHKVYIVGETTTTSIKSGDLFIVISGSGGTETLLPLMRRARDLGAEVIVISMKKKSPMADIADQVFALGAGSEYSFITTEGMPMGTVFELSALIFLESIIARIVHENGITEEQMRAIHANLE
ncbi:MAG TPA: 6-phospho-3-hexuloisomerase [Methylophilaceae bacterium]